MFLGHFRLAINVSVPLLGNHLFSTLAILICNNTVLSIVTGNLNYRLCWHRQQFCNGNKDIKWTKLKVLFLFGMFDGNGTQ